MDPGSINFRGQKNRNNPPEIEQELLDNFRRLRASRDGSNPDRQQSRSARDTPSTPSTPSTVYYNSKRFPNMYMSSSFYNDVMNITNEHVSLYESRWLDFGQHSNSNSNIQILDNSEQLKESTTSWNDQSMMEASSTSFAQRVDNYNSYNKNFINSLACTDQFPTKQSSVSTLTPSSSESYSASSSPSDFENSTYFNLISSSNRNAKKLFEENNNKVIVIENNNHKSESISSDSSKSETNDEKTVSYAEVIKHSKPITAKLLGKSELNIAEESKKGEFVKSNRIPPSKKISFQVLAPDAPFLPNNQCCAFCKNNGEEESVYRTHIVKDDKCEVVCPILFRYTCPNCKATGTKAHTVGRCPLSSKNKINKLNKYNSDK